MMIHVLASLDIMAATIALYAYHAKGFWFYGMLSYVSLLMVAVYTSCFITGDFKLYADHVSMRWVAVDAGLIGYMTNDIFMGRKDARE